MASKVNSGEVFSGGATTSQHVDAENDDHFENTTFKLKRTRSLGLLDGFIDTKGEKEKQGQSTDENVPPQKTDGSESKESEIDDKKLVEENDGTSANDSSGDGNTGVAPTSILMKSPEALPHDDTDIMNEPSRHVDYLSHKWDMSDISKSWRYVIQKRKDVANSARLENASWRTWAQRRSNLKTISPEVVNWSKDNDVTWLYGPILKDEGNLEIDEDDNKRATTATSAVAGDISIPKKKSNGPKPILKRRTVQDMMISHSDLLKLQLATNRVHQDQEQARIQHEQQYSHRRQNSDEPPEFDDYDAISAKLNSQYKTRGDGSYKDLREAQSSIPKYSLTSSSSGNSLEQLRQSPLVDSKQEIDKQVEKSKEKRHIHFNDEVQQCIAVDTYSDEDSSYDEEDDDNYYYDDDDYDEEEGYIYDAPDDSSLTTGDNQSTNSEESDSEDEGGFFLKVKSPTAASAPGLTLHENRDSPTNNDNTEDTDTISTDTSKLYRTIHLLPSTTINYGSSDDESSIDGVYSGMAHNFNNNSNKGYDYYYDYNTVYTVDPNHAIYGNNSDNGHKEPDVIDVPKDIALGSNFDYEIIENDDFKKDDAKMPIINPSVIKNNNPNYQGQQQVSDTTDNKSENQEKLSISSLENSASVGGQKQKSSPFELSDSENESSEDSDDGLSIGTRSSSQSLAHLVFGQTMTPGSVEERHYPESFESREPIESHISKLNPRHSSTAISKQSTSSSSLSQQFFGGMTKKSGSSSSLADAFLGVSDSNKGEDHTTTSSLASSDDSRLPPSSSTHNKASPLPPQTSVATAFRGTSPAASSSSVTSAVPIQKQKSGFNLRSDSDEETSDLDTDEHRDLKSKTLSYASLSEVADRNGIRSPTPTEIHDDNTNYSPSSIMGQAKGLANHFLGNWKNNE
ncbi:uncharacterized protein PRCAT00004963001 [Priceomyces carsonii]|uniref:uncharacterized protein n=1 Tax=Priceomyces carsonii TaxID=28549 RepID=UPI002EDA1EDA|nr:unnamed protein product [Priceomyces carsonii]